MAGERMSVERFEEIPLYSPIRIMGKKSMRIINCRYGHGHTGLTKGGVSQDMQMW